MLVVHFTYSDTYSLFKITLVLRSRTITIYNDTMYTHFIDTKKGVVIVSMSHI